MKAEKYIKLSTLDAAKICKNCVWPALWDERNKESLADAICANCPIITSPVIHECVFETSQEVADFEKRGLI